MVKVAFYAGGAFLFTMIALAIFPTLHGEAFKLGTWSVKGYYILGAALLGAGLKWAK
jgi:hypothetical protein